MTTPDPRDHRAATSVDEDVVTLLQAQHEQIKHLFAAVESAPVSGRDALFCDLRRLLAVHETAEEEVVYPALRLIGGDGDEIADARVVEEGRAKEHLAELEKLDEQDTQFLPRLVALKGEIVVHAQNEEHEVFPMLRTSVPEDRRRTMAKAVQLAEAAAPTHPHPHGPDSAVGNLVVGPFAAVADRVRDALRGSP